MITGYAYFHHWICLWLSPNWRQNVMYICDTTLPKRSALLDLCLQVIKLFSSAKFVKISISFICSKDFSLQTNFGKYSRSRALLLLLTKIPVSSWIMCKSIYTFEIYLPFRMPKPQTLSCTIQYFKCFMS